MNAARLSKAVLALIAAGATSTAIATQFLGEKEGVALTAYQDGASVWTICHGHTQGVRPGQTATPANCADFLASDMGGAFDALDRMVEVPLSKPARAGLASWVFNVGEEAARTSTLIRKLNAGNRASACDELRRWVYSGGKDCRDPANNCSGIPRRREQERALCLL
jgi:lysozyme